MSAPTLAFTTQYIITASTRVGYISITDTTDWNAAGIDPADVAIFLEITDPSGLVWHPAVIPTLPDILPSVSTNFQQQLQRDITGNPMAGTYTVAYTAVVSGLVSPGTYTLAPVESEMCSTPPVVCIESEIDCLYMYGQLIDKTPWGTNNYVLSSRSMTLTWPQNIPGGGPSPVTTTSTTIDIPVGYLYTGTYSVLAQISATQGATTYNLVVRTEFKADCIQSGQDLCSMLCCLESAYKITQSQNPQVYQIGLPEFYQMVALFNIAQAQASCGHGEALGNTLKKFYALGNCSDKCLGDCGCGGSSSTDCGCGGPTLLVPIHPGAGGGSTNVTLAAGPGIDVSYDSLTSTWTVGLSNAALLAAIYNAVVDSPDNSIVWTNATVAGNPPTKTYSGAVRVPAQDTMTWTETWTPLTNARAASTPVLNPATGNVFKNTFVGSATGIFNTQWQVGNFFSGATVDYDIEIEITNVVAAAGYGATVGTNGIGSIIAIDNPQHNATTFTFSLVLAADALGGVIGTRKKLDDVFWQRYIDSFQVIYKLTKKLS